MMFATQKRMHTTVTCSAGFVGEWAAAVAAVQATHHCHLWRIGISSELLHDCPNPRAVSEVVAAATNQASAAKGGVREFDVQRHEEKRLLYLAIENFGWWNTLLS